MIITFEKSDNITMKTLATGDVVISLDGFEVIILPNDIPPDIKDRIKFEEE